jgi:hypothetical protein
VTGAVAGWAPLAGLTEAEDPYLIEVGLPGVRREDLTVETTGSTLVISGEFTQKERSGLLRSQTRWTGRTRGRRACCCARRSPGGPPWVNCAGRRPWSTGGEGGRAVLSQVRGLDP